MEQKRDVIVFLETFGEMSEKINKKLLGVGNMVATKLGGNLLAIVVGNQNYELNYLKKYNIATLYHIVNEKLYEYNGEIFSWAAKEVLKNIPFRLLLFAHSDIGSELAPRIASYLDTVAINDCVDIRIRKGILFYVRFLYNGQFEQEITFKRYKPEVVSIRTDAFEEKEMENSKQLSIKTIMVDIPEDLKGSAILELIPPDYKTVDICYAKLIICAGSGCGEQKLLGHIEELSNLLEGSIGTTRPMVDDGFFSKERMIGQTGKSVAPDLYIALGVSGSPHHVAGIQQAKKILSVNVDSRAPIFGVSDECFVGDLNVILPKLIDRIKRFKGEGLL